MFNMFNPIYLLLLCLRSYVNVRLFPVVSCMARCCVLFFFKFDLSRAAFCTVQSLSQEELVLFLKKETEVHLSRGFSGRMARITGGGRGLGRGGREGVERNIHFSFL